MYLEEPKIEFLTISLTNIVCSSDCIFDGNFGGGGITSCFGPNPDADDMFSCRKGASYFEVEFDW